MNCNRLKRTPSADCCNTETLPSRPRTLRRYHWTLCALAGDRIAASAQAAMTKIKFQPNSADINDLDHRLVHTRRIDGISLGELCGHWPYALRWQRLRAGCLIRTCVTSLFDAAINPGIDRSHQQQSRGDHLHPHPRATAFLSIESGRGRRALILKTLVRLGVGRMRPFSVRRRPFPLRMRRLHDPRRRTPKHKQKISAITHRFKLRTPKEILHAKDHLVA